MQLKNNLFIVLFFVTSARETIKEGEPLVDLKTRELHEQLLSEVPWHLTYICEYLQIVESDYHLPLRFLGTVW